MKKYRYINYLLILNLSLASINALSEPVELESLNQYWSY